MWVCNDSEDFQVFELIAIMFNLGQGPRLDKDEPQKKGNEADEADLVEYRQDDDNYINVGKAVKLEDPGTNDGANKDLKEAGE